MPSTGNLKGPSFSQHFTMTVICIVLLQVLLQALTVAVTYMYFNNEVKQVSSHVVSAAAGYLSVLCLCLLFFESLALDSNMPVPVVDSNC